MWMSTENELFIDFCKNGNQKSFEMLFFRIKPWLTKMLFRIVGDTDATYDLQQETWIKLIKTCHKFDPKKGKFNNFIFTIAKNEALKWKTNSDSFLNDYTYKANGQAKKANKNDIEKINPETIAQINEKCKVVKNAVSLLEEPYQDIILLYYFAEFDVNEIANITNIPVGTIKSYLKRGREKLKELLPNYIEIK